MEEEVADPVSPVVPKEPDTIINMITGDDIQSYNLSTGEIIFTGFTVQDILDRRVGIWFGIPDGFRMPFYFGEKLLFEANCVSPLSSIPYHDLTLTWYDGKCYLIDSYPAVKIERWQEILEIFINYLRDAGKIVE